MGVLLFRKWNLKRIDKSNEEIKELCIKFKCYSWELSDKHKYQIVPLGLPIWLLFLLIIWSCIPIVNFIAIIVYIAVILSKRFDDNFSFNDIFGKEYKFINKIKQFLNFLNKKL